MKLHGGSPPKPSAGGGGGGGVFSPHINIKNF